MSAGACLLVVLFIALGLAAAVAEVVRSSPPPRPRDHGDDDDGGSQPPVPPDAPPAPSGATPDWWRAFEREFADFVQEREGPRARA